jgi:hypothetical protein
MRRDMLRDVAAYLSPRAEKSVMQLADSTGREAPKKVPFKIRRRCRRSQHLLYYADRPIPWPNCS